MITEPTKTTKRTETLTNHILTNSPEKIIKSGTIEMRLCLWAHLLYQKNVTFEIKQTLQNINKVNDITEIKLVAQLRALKSPDYSNFNCVNDAYQGFLTKPLAVIDFVAPIRTLRIKSNTKPWFDIDFLNAIQNRDKHHKKIKQ